MLILAQAAASSASNPGVWTTVEHIGLLAAIASALAAIVVARRKKERMQIMPQPLGIEGDIRVIPKGRRWNADLCDSRHSVIDKRLDAHDVEIKDLWLTLRSEDAEIRQSLARAIHEFDQLANRIDGTLAAVEKTNNAILQRLLREG